MPNPLYELYAKTYSGESLLTESNFTQNVKSNKVFVENFKKNLQKTGMTPEAIGTYFSQSEPKKAKPTQATQPDVPLSNTISPVESNQPVLDTQVEKQPIVPSQEQTGQISTETGAQPPLSESQFDNANFYAEDLIKLADHVGLTQKYPADVIRANSVDPKFINKIVKELEFYPYAKEQLPGLKQEKKYATRSLFKQYFGKDYTETDIKEKDVESLVGEAQKLDAYVKDRFNEGSLPTIKEKADGYQLLGTLEGLMESDPVAARKYFTQNIDNNSSVSALYKKHVTKLLGSHESTWNKTSSMRDVKEIDPWRDDILSRHAKEFGQVEATYANKIKESLGKLAYDSKIQQDLLDKQIEEENKTAQKSIYAPSMSKDASDKDWNISATTDLLKSLEKLIAQTETDDVFVDDKNFDKNAPIGANIGKALAIGELGRFSIGVSDAHLPFYDGKVAKLMLDVLNKQDKGEELRTDEENLLRSYALLTNASQNLDRSFAFSIGQGLPNNLVFMASLALTSGIMGVVEKGVAGVAKKALLQQAQKQLASTLGKKLATNLSGWAPKLVGNLVGNAAITPLQPMFVDFLMKNKLGTINLKDGSDPRDLELDLSRKDKMNNFKAATNAFRQTYVENVSESSGIIFDKGLNKMFKGANARRAIATRNDFALAKTARVNGVVSEILEEYVAIGLNAPFEGWEKTEDQLTLRQFAEIVVGTAIFTVPAGGFSAYQLHNRKKEINKAADDLTIELGPEKFSELSEIFRLATVDERKLSLDEFGKRNKLNNDQYGALLRYGALRTVFDIQEGYLKRDGLTKGLSSTQKATRAGLRSQRTTALEQMAGKLAPEKFAAIEAEKKAGLADETKDSDAVQREYKLALASLLRSDELSAETDKINRNYAKQIHDSTHGTSNLKSELYNSMSDFDQALSRTRNNSRSESAEKAKGKNLDDVYKLVKEAEKRLSKFDGRDKRIAEIEEQLKGANVTKTKRLQREKDALLAMTKEESVKDAYALEYFNERKESLKNIQNISDSRNIRTRFDESVSYEDEQGNMQRLQASPDLAEFNQIHDQVIESNSELQRLKVELNRPMPTEFEGKKEVVIWQEQRDKDRADFDKLLSEKNRMKSEAEDKFTDIYGPTSKGQQVAKTSTEELKKGQKVVLEDAISGATMNAEVLVEGTEKESGQRYAIIQFQAKNGTKYQLTYVPGENSDYRLYESKDHESRGAIETAAEKTNRYYAGKPSRRVFKNEVVFEKWNKKRKEKKDFVYDTESVARAKHQEFVLEWGQDMVTEVWNNKETGQFGFRLRKGFLETSEQRLERYEQEALRALKLSNEDYIRDMQLHYNAMSEDEKRSQQFARENGYNFYLSYNQWVQMNLKLLTEATVLSNDSRGGVEDMTKAELELVATEAQIVKATEHLIKMTGTPIVFAENDPTGKERKGWQQGDVYVVNRKTATLDTPIHEYAHPIFDAIETENKPLFDKLYAELESTPEGREIIAKVKARYPERSDQYQKKEALVTAVGMKGVKYNQYDGSLFARIVYKIRTVFNNWLQKVTRHKGIKYNTTLEQLAKLIVEGRIKRDNVIKTDTGNTHKAKIERAIKNSLPQAISRAITIVDSVPMEILGNKNFYFSIKDLLGVVGITDPLLINWAGVNKDAIGNLKSITSQQYLENLISSEYEKISNPDNYPELKTNELARKSFDKWLAILEKYPLAFRHLMLNHATKYIRDAERRNKYVIELGKSALADIFEYITQNPHEANRVGKLYDAKTVESLSDATEHEPSASGRGYWVHVPQTKQPNKERDDDNFLDFDQQVFLMQEAVDEGRLDQDVVDEFKKTRSAFEAERLSLKNKSDQFNVNVEMLKKLSPSTWCTSGNGMAKTYVENYDNYILIVDGQAVNGIEVMSELNSNGKRKIHEITSRNNNGVASVDYLDDTIAFLDKHGFDSSDNVESLKNAKTAKNNNETDNTVKNRDEDENEYYNEEQDYNRAEYERDLAEERYSADQERAEDMSNLFRNSSIEEALITLETNKDLYVNYGFFPPHLNENPQIAANAVAFSSSNIEDVPIDISNRLELAIKAYTTNRYTWGYLTVDEQVSPEIRAIKDEYDRLEEERRRNLTPEQLQAEEELPFSKTVNNQIQGYYDPKTDRVIVVSSNISVEEAPQIAIHEVAHRGMLRMAKDLGGVDALYDVLKASESQLMEKLPELLKRTRHPNLKALLRDYGFTVNSKEGEIKLLMELAARWAETLVNKPQPSWWKQLTQAIGKWITKFTGKILTEQEVDELIGGFVKYGTNDVHDARPNTTHLQQQVVDAVTAGKPFWIRYSSTQSGKGDVWRRVDKATLSVENNNLNVTEGTGFSALDDGAESATVVISDQRLLAVSLTDPTVQQETVQPQELKPVAVIPQNKVSGVESFGSLVTANDKVIEQLGPNPHSIDMIEAGLRTRTTRSVGEMEKYSIKVGDVILHKGLSADGTIKTVFARVTAIHPKGSIEWKSTWEKEGWRKEDVSAIDKFKDGAAAIEFEVINQEQEYEAPLAQPQEEVIPEQPKVEEKPARAPKIYISPSDKSSKAYKHVMTVAATKYNELLNDPNNKQSKSEKAKEATKAALLAYAETEYYKKLITSDERKIDNQILSDLIQKMLRKQKNIIDESGLQSMVEAIEGVASTSEDRMKQFESGLTPILNEISAKIGISPVKLKIEFLDMFKRENIVDTEKEFQKLYTQYSDELQKKIAQAVVDSPTIDFKKYISMANFFGSIHIEDQYGIRITDGVALIYNQVVSITDKNLRADFRTYNARMNKPDNMKVIQEAMKKYQAWGTAEFNRFAKVTDQTENPLSADYLTEFVDLMSAVTDFDKAIIREYLNNPRATDGLFIKKDGQFKPVDGQTFNQLAGQVIYRSPKNDQWVNSIAMATTLMSKIRNNDKGLSLQKIIRNHMEYKAGKSSNLDFLVESYTRNEQTGTEGLDVEGNRFQTFSLNHHLYQATLTIDKTIQDQFLAQYYRKTPMHLAKFDGIKNMDTDKVFSSTKIDEESLWFGMLMAYNVSGNEYQQFLGQFSDKTTVYTANTLKRLETSDYAKAKIANPIIDKDIDYIEQIIRRNFNQFGFTADNEVGMKEFAKNFTVSFTLNLDTIGTVIHGSIFLNTTGKKQYKGLDDLIKRAQVTISPGYNYMVNVEGGVADKINYVIVDDYIMRDLKNMGIEQLDGLNIGSEAYMAAAQKSSGSIFARTEDFPQLDSIKGAISYVNEFGERILIKSLVDNINIYSNTFSDVAIYERLKNYMAVNKIDVLSFPSSAKKFGSHQTTSLFFNTMMPVSEVSTPDKTWDVTELLKGLNLISLQQQDEAGTTLYEQERNAETEKGVAFQDTKAYQKLKQNMLMRISTSELLKASMREQLALANEEGQEYLFFDNKNYGTDLMTAFNEVMEELFQRAEINESQYNKPKILSIPRENFYIQQDLRHEKSPHAQDISTQMYTNLITLPRYAEFIKNLTDANGMQYNFNKKFFNGFQDKEIIREYLLFNTNKAEDPDLYAMIEAWAINDPTFSNKIASKLINTLNRDVLEVNINRQSSFEMADVTGRLKGLRKIIDSEGVERSLLPEIAVNIPGIRYAKEFKTREDAVAFMNDNKDTLVDLQNDNFSLQFWQLYKDGNKWIVPGEPIISSRTPAGNLNCHTVARARFKINSSSAITILDIESRKRSGSDFDGDARYNWTFSKFKGVTLLDNTYQGRVNKALMAAVRDYEDVQNYSKILTPIDTEAFDGIIKSLGIKESTNATFKSLKDQEKFRSRNMTGYNMKGIMSNLTTAFSYLKYFEAPGIVQDKFNMVKVVLDNLLNLSFDNAKDPKIEKLGLNESTASMFVYELITDASIDQATNEADAKDAVMKVMQRLVEKYSDYSLLLQDKIVSEYMGLVKEDKKSLFSETEPIMKRLKESNSTSEGPNALFKQFSEVYYAGKDLEAFGKVKGLRDGIPHKMSEFLLARANVAEFIQGKDMPRFYDSAAIPTQDSERPALTAIYKTMELGTNAFNNMPGMRFIDGLIGLMNTNYNIGRRDVYAKAKNITNSVTDETDEIVPLTTYRHLPYLMGIRHGRSFKATSIFLNEKLKQYETIQSMTFEEQRDAGYTEQQTIPNAFMDALISTASGDYYQIRLAPSLSNTKLSAQYEQELRTGFDFLSEELQDAFAYNSLVAYGFNEGIKGGGYFGLISPKVRIRMASQSVIDSIDFVNSAIQKRIIDGAIVYGKEKGKSSVSQGAWASKLPTIKEILIDEKLDLTQLEKMPTISVDKILDQLQEKPVADPISVERIAYNQEKLGLKSKEEFIVVLKKLKESFANVKHQLDDTNDFTEATLQDPEVFEFMFNHFKKIYPGLTVFNNALEFAEFIRTQTGRDGNFNLTALGAAFSNAVYLSNNARQDTFFHEVAHIYWDALDIKDSVKMNLRSLYGWKDSMKIDEKEAIDEKIIQDIGKIGTDRTTLRFKGDRLQLFLSYLQQFWNRVKSVFGLTQKSRAESEIFFLQQVMSDRIWNNGTEVPQSAIDALVRYQIEKTDYDSVLVNGREVTTADTWLRSQKLNANNVGQELDEAYTKFGFEISSIAEDPANRTSFNGDYVAVDETGRVFLKDQSGNIIGHSVNPNEITRQNFQEAFLTTRDRERVLNQAVRAMAKGSATTGGIDNFKIDNDQFEFDEYFDNPVEAYKEVKKIVDDLKIQFNPSGATNPGQFILTPALFDDQSDHTAFVDVMGIDAAGQITIVRIVPTFVHLNKDSVESSEYTDQNGYYTKSSPMNGLPTSKKEEIRLEMVQFATMLSEYRNPKGIKMIAIPVFLEIVDGKVVTVEREAQTTFDFTDADKTLGKTILAKIKEEKSPNNSFNLNHLLTGLKKNINESKAIQMTINAIKSIQRITGSVSTLLSTHNVILNAKLGYGRLLDNIIKHGWSIDMFLFEPNTNFIQQTKKFTSKIPLKSDGSAQLIYGSPGWGKKLAASLSSDFVDSSFLLERLLFTNESNSRLLASDSPTVAALKDYSKYHEITDELENGSNKKLTWDILISDYHNNNWTKELFAYKASLLIDRLRKIAIKELIATGYHDDLKLINPNNIVAIRAALVGKTGDGIEMIKINTPYEELKTSIEQALASGKHVLTSTLVNKEHLELFDVQYDKAFRLVKNVNNDIDNENSDSQIGPLGMHERSIIGNNVTSANYQNQKWIKRRFQTEIDRFSGKSYVSYTNGFATDDLYNEKLSTQDGKITDMRVAYYIDHLAITREQFEDAFKKNPELTITEYVLGRARNYYMAGQLEFDADGVVKGSAKNVYDGIITREVEKFKGKGLAPYKALGLSKAPETESDYYDAVQIWKQNKTRADKIWSDFGSFGNFISLYDQTSQMTQSERGINQRQLAKIFEEISKLDQLNKDGLWDIVGNQIATNYILNQVKLEASDPQRSNGYRMHTVLLDKMMSDPSFTWVDTERKWEWLGMDWTWMIKRMADMIVNYKLDRSVDIKHTLGQTLAFARMENDHKIKDDVMKSKTALDEMYSKMTDKDKENIIYLYGEKGVVKDGTGRTLYAGDKYKKFFGRLSYISVNEAIDLVAKGEMSNEAYKYLNLVRSWFMKFDQAYANQQKRTNYAAPTFVPDFIALKESGKIKNQVANHSEFVREVQRVYGIDISGDGVFIDKLYKALDTSKEGGYLLQGLEDSENNNLIIYEGMILSQAKRMMFMPEVIIDEATTNGVSVREVLNQKVKDFEILRYEANKNKLDRYVESDRAFKTHGSFSKGIILRTRKFNEATQMYLNSLILNYHTTAVTPFAFMAEEKYEQHAEGSPIMAKWSKKYIDANFFKFKQSGSEGWNEFMRLSGLYLSLNSLGLNVSSGIGNFTAGQLQSFFLHRKQYRGAVARINQLPKAIKLMHRHHIGMVLEDLDLKESAKTLEKVSKVGFIITETVENINQGMGFLSQMTDAEFDSYNENGELKPGAQEMSLFRVFQIEAKIREINGDYGKNRALYRTNPFLMEWGRFKMGWWQAMIQTHVGTSYVDMWGEYHISVGETLSNVFQHNAFALLNSKWFGVRTRDAITKKVFANIMKNKSIDKVTSDTEEEAIKKVLANGKMAAPTKVYKIEVNGKDKFIAINQYDEISLWSHMSYEMLSDLNSRDYSKVSDKEKEQLGRAAWELTAAGFLTVSGALLLYTLSGLASGAGDPENDENVDLWLAFLDGYHHFGFWNIFNPIGAKPVIPLDPLKQYSSLNKGEWRAKYILEMLNNYSTRSLTDIMLPYTPEAWSKMGDGSNIPIVKTGLNIFNFAKQLGDINSNFDYISEKQGFNDQTNKLMFYGRKLFLGKGLIDAAYRATYMDKQSLEESQVSILAKRAYAQKYKTRAGMKNEKPNFSDPKTIAEFERITSQQSNLYFGNRERKEHKTTQKIDERNAIGAKNIKEGMEDARVNIDLIREASERAKKKKYK